MIDLTVDVAVAVAVAVRNTEKLRLGQGHPAQSFCQVKNPLRKDEVHWRGDRPDSDGELPKAPQGRHFWGVFGNFGSFSGINGMF